jgi:DNA (cytosine-5)-methyltransferase 1
VTPRPRLLDLYCGEGGAARGYADAGFEVYGVEKNFRLAKHYLASGAYAINWSDVALWDSAFILDLVTANPGFQAIHASPPCQVFTELNSRRERHVNLIPHTRRLLEATGLPYVIENVRAAKNHLIRPVSLFGQMFNCHLITSRGQRFDLSRERLFETNWPLTAPPCPNPP